MEARQPQHAKEVDGRSGRRPVFPIIEVERRLCAVGVHSMINRSALLVAFNSVVITLNDVVDRRFTLDR